MSYLTSKQSVGYILKAISNVDSLTLEPFIKAIYVTLDTVDSEAKHSNTDTMESLDYVLVHLDLSEDQNKQTRKDLYNHFDIYTPDEAEEFYNQFVTESILKRLL